MCTCNPSPLTPIGINLPKEQIETLKRRARAVAYFEDRDYDINALLIELVNEGTKRLKPYIVKPKITPIVNNKLESQKVFIDYNYERPPTASAVKTYDPKDIADLDDINEVVENDKDGHFQLNLGSDLDKMLGLVTGQYKTTPIPGEPAHITAPVDRPATSNISTLSPFMSKFAEDQHKLQKQRKSKDITEESIKGNWATNNQAFKKQQLKKKKNARKRK